MNDTDKNPNSASPPGATGPAGPRLEGKVGAFYFLALLAGTEPRGLAGAKASAIRFQQSAHGRPFDDITIDAVNADGTDAFLDIQAKRSIDFVKSNSEFGDVVRHLWTTSQQPRFLTTRYEVGVAVQRSSTRIERSCQEVLHWARQLDSGATFAAHINLAGFSSQGMRDFVDAFRHHLAAAGAPTDDDTIWQLLRRFQILVFDFDSPGSDYDHRVRELARAILSPDHAERAANLWSTLIDRALLCDTAGGEIDAVTLKRQLAQEHGYQFGDRPDLRTVHERLTESTDDALADIKDHIGQARLSRVEIVDNAYQALDTVRTVQIVGTAGVGKSAVLKSLVARLQPEGTILVLTPDRIIGGGWLKMARALSCPVSRNDLFNELGCGGAATLFVDNIDQIEDPQAWATLRDLLRSVHECPGWRAVFTARAENQEWRANLPDDLRKLPFQSVRVGEIIDAEADVLRAGNPALAALLSGAHPARAIARNLFHLSRMADVISAGDQSAQSIVSEIDLAQSWWRFGGGRSENGKWKRLKLLRSLGETLILHPSLSAFSADNVDSRTVAELIRYESLREHRLGATIAFWHDTLRDWTVGFLLDEKPALFDVLPINHPIPGTLSRGVEIAARLALRGDATGGRWLSLLSKFEQPGCHGSWRRPILLALPHAENALELFNQVEAVLVADKGRRLTELIRLMIAVESEPLDQVLSRIPASTRPNLGPVSATMVVPTGPGWMPLVIWVLLKLEQLPSAITPDAAKLFQLWLIATQAQAPEINAAIVSKQCNWLLRIEEALRPGSFRNIDEAKEASLDFGKLREVHDEIRMTFVAFCHLNPNEAARYFRNVDTDWHHGAKDIVAFYGSAARAAPAALADFALAVLIPKEDEDDRHYPRSRYDRLGPFELFDTEFVPASPGRGPFFDLLESSPVDGLRLIRGLVEHATNFYRDLYAVEGKSFPDLTIPFSNGLKVFVGPYGMYQSARGGTGSLIVASALMALEAWGHRQIEAGRSVADVLEDVLGPSGSSCAFLCVAVDLVLSHWDKARNQAWPLLASPELLQFDQMRFEQDISGLGRFSTYGQELAHWPVKVADLMVRPSRQHRLSDLIGDFAIHGPPDLHAQLQKELKAACERIGSPNAPASIDGLQATAARAYRMSNPAHWHPDTVQLADGRQASIRRYKPAPEEEQKRQIEGATANLQETNLRLTIQKALSEPSASTPEIVAQAIEWARSQADGVSTAPSADTDSALDDDDDDFDSQWKERAIVMAAALAALDYKGEDPKTVTAWALPILDRAAAGEENSHIGGLSPHQIYSDKVAIAAIGYVGIYRRERDEKSQERLLRLASRGSRLVIQAIGTHLSELDAIDPRLPRALARIIFDTNVRPRTTLVSDGGTANAEALRQRREDAVEHEVLWLGNRGAEPSWPQIDPWHSRRRRGFRIPSGSESDEPQQAAEPEIKWLVDEQALSIWIGHLIRLTIGEVREWVVTFSEHLMGWTIEANNGPPGHDEEERENRPTHWNLSFFNFLGILCVALPFERVRSLFLEPMARLHEEAFHDAVGSFLRGFDNATLATDTKNPDDPRAVRTFIVERLRRDRMFERLNHSLSFTAETHLADALSALFYQPSRRAGGNGEPYIPEKWSGLPDTISLLTPLVAATPNSGYFAVIFLRLVETFPCAALLPEVVQAASAWCSKHGAGSPFWGEHQIGHRICAWIDKVVTDEPDASAIADLRDDLVRCLDILVQSGVASAHLLELKLNGEDPQHQNLNIG